MIRDAVLHLANEQPMLADLFELPRAPAWAVVTAARPSDQQVGRDARIVRPPRQGPHGSADRTRLSLAPSDPSLAHRLDDRLRPAPDRELAQDHTHVVLDRLFADREGQGNVFVPHARGDGVEDLGLASR